MMWLKTDPNPGASLVKITLPKEKNECDQMQAFKIGLPHYLMTLLFSEQIQI